VTVKIDSLEESGKRFVDAYEKIQRGEKAERQEILSFESIEVMRQILTNEKIRLLKLINAENPKTIYALAQIAKRPYVNVFRDVKKLAEMGLIDLAQEKEKSGVRPIGKYDELKISLPL